MGNNQSFYAQEEHYDAAAANIGHFDHSFPCSLKVFEPADLPPPVKACTNEAHVKMFGDRARICELCCRMESFAVIEDIGTSISLQHRELVEIRYEEVEKNVWDHSSSSVKFTSRHRMVVLDCEDSLELERELKQRLKFVQRKAEQEHKRLPRMPSFEYMGTYASSKPKPFQRKRASLNRRQQAKLPLLSQMRSEALSRHQGSGKPVPGAMSKRMKLFREHVHHGTQTIPLKKLNGLIGVPSEGACLVLDYHQLRFEARGKPVWEAQWSQVNDYEVYDLCHQGERDNGVRFFFDQEGCEHEVFCVVDDVKTIMHTVEHFFNAKLELAAPTPLEFTAKPKSTHGRRVQKVYTLTGDSAPPSLPDGNKDVISDVTGALVPTSTNRATQANSMSMISSSAVDSRTSSSSSASKVLASSVASWTKSWKILDTAVPVAGALSQNSEMAPHWPSICVHQGWLLKRGGLAWSWKKRYAVLYRTAQGHFLCYYSDFSSSPLFSKEENERNIIDLSKTTFIRPSSMMKEAPPYAFDVCTIDREWTLCPDTRKEQQIWLQLITRAIDEDLAIIPDTTLDFLVKARFDPSQELPLHEYQTSLRVSASGVSVAKLQSGEWVEVLFWCFTDFFKWSTVSHYGKTGIQLSIFSGDSFDSTNRREFLFRSRDAHRIASAIEFYIEKFMAVMGLWLEGEAGEQLGQEGGAATSELRGAGTSPGSLGAMRLDTDAANYEDEDLLSGFDFDSEPTAAADKDTTDFEVVVPHVCEVVVPTVAATATPTIVSSQHLSSTDPLGLARRSEPLEASVAQSPKSMATTLKLPQVPEQHLSDNTLASGIEASLASFSVQPTADVSGGGKAPPLAPLVVQPPYDSDVLFAELQSKPTGLLFRDHLISVTMQQEYRGSQARTFFEVTSVRQSQQAFGLSLVGINASIGLEDVGREAVRLQLQSPPQVLESGGKFQIGLQLECMQPFSGTPSLNLNFIAGAAEERREIRFPMSLLKFMSPFTLGDGLQARWLEMGVRDELEASSEITNDQGRKKLPTTALQAMEMITAVANLELIHGLDNNEVFTCGTLHTGTLGKNGSKITVGCIIKISMSMSAGPGAVQKAGCHVAVRTPLPSVSSHLLECIIKILT